MIESHHLLIATALIVFSTAWFLNYPAFTDADGMEYATQAWLFAHGKTLEENELYGYALPIITKPDQSQVAYSRFPFGYALLLTPFTFLGFKALFLSSLLVHILLFFVIYFLLKKLQLNPIFSLIFFFFPLLVFQSYQVMSDAPALLLLLAGIYFLLHPSKPILAAIFLGISIWMRYVNALFMIPWIILWYNENKPDKKQLLKVMGIIGGFIVVLLAFNWTQYGELIGYNPTGELDQFSMSGALRRGMQYLLLFIVGNNPISGKQYFEPAFIPLMVILVALACWKKSKFMQNAVWTTIIAIVFFSTYGFDPNIRFMLTPLILCCIGFIYVITWATPSLNIGNTTIALILTLLMGISSYGLIQYYNNSLSNNAFYSSQVYQYTTTPNTAIITPDLSHYIYPGFGARKIIHMNLKEVEEELRNNPTPFENCHCDKYFFMQLLEKNDGYRYIDIKQIRKIDENATT